MKTCRTAGELRSVLKGPGMAAARIGFVPTMGALHEGHLSLVRAARENSESVVMSIFVNPLQFGPTEDFESYPRAEDKDIELAETSGVDLLFIPPVQEVYAPGHQTTVKVGGTLTAVLEGRSRPGHFDGVSTVVAALFGFVSPHSAYLGEKDAQQLAVVRRMTSDLKMNVAIRGCPIVRDPDGLALSSRNVYLSASQREQALALFRSLQAAEAAHEEGAGPFETEAVTREVLSRSEGVDPEYVAAVDPDTFEPADGSTAYRICIAARVGPARLIDNVLLTPQV